MYWAALQTSFFPWRHLASLLLNKSTVAWLQGSVAHGGGSGRVNDVQLVGYDERFWKLSPSGTGPEDVTQVYLNRPLADRMNVKPGEMILLRMAKPSAIPRDAPLSDDENFLLEALEIKDLHNDRPKLKGVGVYT